MMSPHEFFRNAAEQRRKAIFDLAITGGESTLQELVLSETPMQDTSIPQKKQIRLTLELLDELLILKTEVI